MWIGVAIVIFVLLSAAGWYWERSRVHALPVVSEADFLARKPADVSAEDWISLGRHTAAALEIPANRLAPSQQIADLHQRLTLLGTSSVDIPAVLDDLCVDRAHTERVLSRLNSGGPATLGDLMELVIRERP